MYIYICIHIYILAYLLVLEIEHAHQHLAQFLDRLADDELLGELDAQLLARVGAHPEESRQPRAVRRGVDFS